MNTTYRPTNGDPVNGRSTVGDPAGLTDGGLGSESSGLWAMVSVGAAAVAQLGLIIVLSRRLEVEAFAPVAAIIALLSLPRMVMDGILAAPIIQRPVLGPCSVRTAGTLSLMASAVLGLGLWVCAPLVEAGFGIDGLTPVVRWLAPTMVLFGLAVAPQALLQRELDFRSMASIDVVSLIGGYLGVGVVAASLGAGVWSIVAAFAAEGALRMVLSVARRPVVPTLRPDRSDLADQARFAGSTGAGSLLNLVATRGDYMVVSRLAGPLALAAYTQAYNVAYNPGLVLSRVMNRWLFPLLSRSGSHSDDGPAEVMVINLRRLGYATGAMAVAVAVLAPEVIATLFGPRWDAAVVPLQIMAVGLPARIMHSVHDAQVKASGLVDRRAAMQAVYAVAVLGLVLFGARQSLGWAAVGLVVAITINYVLMARLAMTSLDLDVGRLLAAHWPVVVGAAAAAVVLIPSTLVARSLLASPVVVLVAVLLVAATVVGVGVLMLLSRQSSDPASSAAGVDTSASIEPSPTIAALLADLDRVGASPVVFKGANGLERSLAGYGDLDLYVPAEQREAASTVLVEHGFVVGPNANWPTERYLSDWFGAGHDGRIVHVQLYHRLVLGGLGGPAVAVPGADRLVASASGDAPMVADPVHAAVIRLCDAALRPGRTRQARTAGVLRLIADTPTLDLVDAARELFDADVSTAVAALLGDPGSRSVRRLRKALTADQRRVVDAGRSPWPTIRAGVAKLNRQTAARPMLARRRLASAPVVAIIGSDGAGKSTVTTNLTRQLGAKLDVRLLYLGTGDGPSSLLRKPLVWMRRLWERRRAKKPAAPTATSMATSITAVSAASSGASSAGSGRRSIPEPARLAWAVTTVLERRAKLRRARRAADAGFVVVCDRYPQARLVGMFDGPRLRDDEPLSKLGRAVSRWERRQYEQMELSPPDLVILLDVSVEVAADRRPEERWEELERRTTTARELRYGTARHVRIDAEQLPDEVLHQTMELVLGACR